MAVGHHLVEDHNRPGAEGVGPIPRNVRDGVRMSTALTHLAPARTRRNLTLRADTMVDRIELSGTGVRGIRLADGEVVDADRVVVAAGAYASPTILMRSGIGPAGSLREAGVLTVVDLPGVGENLSDHPLVAVDLPTSPGFTGPRFEVLVTARCHAVAGTPPDLHLFAAGPFDDPASPPVRCSASSPGSCRPSAELVGLVRPSPRTHPASTLRCCATTTTLRGWSRPLWRHAGSAKPRPWPASSAAQSSRPARPSTGDVAGLTRSITSRVETYNHPTGPCAMAPDPQSGAVVDAQGAVHSVERLWVADASIMPTIPSAHTNLTTIIIAARIADWLATA